MGKSGIFSIRIIIVLLILHSRGLPSKICTPKRCEVRLRTEYGWVCGKIRDAEDGTKYASFRGIPYAKPPLGSRRFKDLEPSDHWDHLLDATEDGTVCPHKDYGYSRLALQLKGMSEDCIHLNLHVPYHIFSLHKEQSDGNVPILVFVHGGGFQTGSSLTDLHGPEYLMMNDLVLITFNFRIGPLGFLYLDTEQIPGNQALRDVITLLRWVQRNARAFGGNPHDVTLMGHSSGATMVHLLSLSEAVEGLIHKVVLMGGNAITSVFPTSAKHATYITNEFLRALGINSTDKEYITQRLYKEPILNIIYAANVVQVTADLGNYMSFVPVVESKFPNVARILDDYPHTLIAKGRGKQYPLLNGFTNAEYNYFKWTILASNPMSGFETKAKLLLPAHIAYNLPKTRQLQIANQIRKLYFNDTTTVDQILDYLSDMVFIYPALKIVEWRAMVGAPVYLYQFSYEAIKSIVKEAHWFEYKGVAHVEDLTNVFRVNSMLDKNDKAIPAKNADDLMRDWMSSFIANFVRCGTPSCVRDDSRWPKSRTMQYQDIRFPMVYDMRNLTEHQREMVTFFDSIDDTARNVQEALSRPGFDKTRK